MSEPGKEPTEIDRSRIYLLERLSDLRTPYESRELQELYLHRWLWKKTMELTKKKRVKK